MPTREAHTISYGGLSDVDPPAFDFKDLRVQTKVGATMSQMTALFDNCAAR